MYEQKKLNYIIIYVAWRNDGAMFQNKTNSNEKTLVQKEQEMFAHKQNIHMKKNKTKPFTNTCTKSNTEQ
jgi:hypothetical protein